MGLIPNTENKLGSDCTGVSGATNRTLTLSNTAKTSVAGFLVYASGLALALTTEYTVVHNSSASVITFLNRMYDDMTIVVSYFQPSSTSNQFEKMRDDFQDIVIDNGKEMTLIRQAETTASMGDVTAIAEEEYNIWVSVQDITRKDRQIHEMGLAVPGNSKAFFFHEYPDSITGNGVLSVEVGDILKDASDIRWRVERIIAQRNADNNEIFRVGIIKKIDLDEDAT